MIAQQASCWWLIGRAGYGPTLALLTVCGMFASASAQEVLVEDEVTLEPAETLAGDDEALATWNPSLVRPREVDGQLCYSRQSSDAFADPDQRLSLEAKYCFELSLDELPKFGNLTHSSQSDAAWKITSADPSKVEPLGSLLPLNVDSQEPLIGAELAWLDYGAGKPPRGLVALVATQDDAAATIEILRGDTKSNSFEATKRQATREFPSAELAADCLPGGRLDVWDIPASLKSKSAFYGRVIALLKQIDGRYAVDLYGDALHPDSDCRLWLGTADHAWGRPIGIRFDELPILKEGGRIVPTAVLAVVFENSAKEQRAIGFDFPICSSPALVQLRKLSQGLAGKDKNAPPPDLAKLVGEDVVDELSRRLVDGQYH